jgi:hypothetical protein
VDGYPLMELSAKIREFQDFGACFAWLLEAGVRHGVASGEPWTEERFGIAFQDIHPGASTRDLADVRKRTNKWFQGAHPNKDAINSIVRIFFGPGASLASLYLVKLYEGSKRRVVSRREFSDEGRTADRAEDWPSLGEYAIRRVLPTATELLFDITMEKPGQGDTQDDFLVHAEVTPGVIEDGDGDLRWEMGLRAFHIIDRSQGCTPIATLDAPLRALGVERRGRGWRVEPDMAGQPFLKGNILRTEPLARMLYDGHSPCMTVVLHAIAQESDLDLKWLDRPENVEPKRLEYIRRWLKSTQGDDTRKVVLGEASMTLQRRP